MGIRMQMILQMRFLLWLKRCKVDKLCLYLRSGFIWDLKEVLLFAQVHVQFLYKNAYLYVQKRKCHEFLSFHGFQ